MFFFSFRVTTGAMIGARLYSVVGFRRSSCIGVSSIPLSMLRVLSKASHDKPSCSQSRVESWDISVVHLW